MNGQAEPAEKPVYFFDQIVASLLENDASVSFPDKSGLNPLAWAEKIKSQEEILQLLRRKRAVIDAKFRHAMFRD